MEEEATIREMESKELTERNEQLRRETGELRLVPTLKRIVSWFIHYSNFTSYQLTVFSNWNCELMFKLGVNLLSTICFSFGWLVKRQTKYPRDSHYLSSGGGGGFGGITWFQGNVEGSSRL